ncbi:hypothetical protein BB050_01295 [Flavobacterium anhuiense]|jgi:hypothetical protein|uniref:Uncharacterized protein n=1 Tax=Flavobacterium anhuiense TaxID=459526 RepID=A0AAC9CYC0_9FLAO|nr:hypothetical protein BB050_01295 [Flavobacterium anhuiense]
MLMFLWTLNNKVMIKIIVTALVVLVELVCKIFTMI